MQLDKSHFDILCKWTRFNSFFNIGDVLRRNGFQNAAIYGGGNLGILLYEALRKVDFPVKYVIDINPDLEFPYDVPVYSPNLILNGECTAEQFSADVILVTPYNVYRDVSKPLEWAGFNCISLRDFIIDMDELWLFQRAYEHVYNQGAELMLLELQHPIVHKNPTEIEKILANIPLSWRDYHYSTDALRMHYDDIPGCSEEYIKEVFRAGPPIALIKKNGTYYLNDIQTKYFNVVNNCRVTTNQPASFDNTIYVFGNCVAVGFFADDSRTVQSFLQQKLLADPINAKTYRVQNCGNWRKFDEAIQPILERQYRRGDIVILLALSLKRYTYYFDNLMYCNLDHALDRPHKFGCKEVFIDNYHINHRGYELLSDEIHRILSQKQEGQRPAVKIDSPSLSAPRHVGQLEQTSTEQSDLENYLEYLKQEKCTDIGTIGAVVMNCNPFTLGHRYLVEQSLKLCDHLYFFVVEEDRSAFKFEDRFEMVKRGVADLQNVKVLRSGKYIISSETFPEYFIKESYNVDIDASQDLQIFAAYIAPLLGISKRFVGEEPLCNVTRQYNQAMKEELLAKGIDVVEFPRISSGEEPISASRVRKMLDEKEYNELTKLVPKSTWEYLCQRRTTVE